MKKKLSLFLLVLCSLGAFLVAIPTRADSGWDSSYDSGGSSSSSWSSSSSSSSYSSDYDSDSDFSSGDVFFLLILLIAVIIYGIYFKAVAGDRTNGVGEKEYDYDDISDDLISEYGYATTELKKELFRKFIAVQNAWMDFDYKELENLCTDELYNMYKSQLNALKLKNGQNMMHDFKLEDLKIVNMTKEGKELVVEVYMRVSFYDYVVNTKTNNVIRGTKKEKIRNNYMMTFVKGEIDTDSVVNCPSCNAKVHVNSRGECEYCHSVIIRGANSFVLSKKVNINR